MIDFTIRGYVFDSNGNYDHYHVFRGTAKSIASFIVMNEQNKTLTDIADTMVCTTIGSYLEHCDPKFLDEIKTQWIKYQTGEEQPQKMKFRFDGDNYVEVGFYR